MGYVLPLNVQLWVVVSGRSRQVSAQVTSPPYCFLCYFLCNQGVQVGPKVGCTVLRTQHRQTLSSLVPSHTSGTVISRGRLFGWLSMLLYCRPFKIFFPEALGLGMPEWYSDDVVGLMMFNKRI